MKRVLCLVMVLCLLLTACNNNSTDGTDSTVSTQSPTLPTLNNNANEDVDDGTEDSANASEDYYESNSSKNDANENTDDETNASVDDAEGDYEDSSANGNTDLANGSDGQSSSAQYKETFELSGTVNAATVTEEIQFLDITSEKLLINSQTGAYDEEAVARRLEIQNTEDTLDLTGMTVLYASPDGDNANDGLTPETALNGNEITNVMYLLKPNTALLFERGGVYRPGSLIEIMTYDIVIGAYGEGPKPQIYGSLYNYSERLWEPTKITNVWKTTITDVSSGNIVFNEGEEHGWLKNGIMSLMNNGDFYHNVQEGYFYLYCDRGNPSDVWYDIEIAPDRSGIGCIGGSVGYNITIDNICIKYFGRHGFQFYGQNHDITITNCEVGWIGGALQDAASFLRYGNGIEFYGGNSYNLLVENNWVYQTYDSGITIQNGAVTQANLDNGCGGWTNVSFKNNVVEFMEACLEIWNATDSKNAWYNTMEYKDGEWVKRDVPLNEEKPEDVYRTFAFMKNIYVEGNVLRFAGYGWSNAQRPLKSPMTITMWFSADSQENFNIKNNVFDFSRDSTFSWLCPVFAQDAKTAAILEKTPGRGLNVSGNTFFMRKNSNNKAIDIGAFKDMKYEDFAVNYGRTYQASYYAYSQAEYELAISQLDSSPKLVKYFD